MIAYLDRLPTRLHGLYKAIDHQSSRALTEAIKLYDFGIFGSRKKLELKVKADLIKTLHETILLHRLLL